ncbi:Alcohol dehydrogenase [Rhodotorula toruloides]
MSTEQLQFRGYAVKDTEKFTEFELIDFEPMDDRDDCLDIAIEVCGICSSDVHTITGGWGDIHTPLVSGHEIGGIVKRVGKNVKGFKVGDRAVVGAQVDSCGKCRPCTDNNENYCPKQVDTYNAPTRDNEKKYSQGGYSTAIRAPEQFVFHVPDELPLEDAAPMACGGLTVFSPMHRFGVKKGTKMGVAGLGGLGHFAVLLGTAMGAEVVVFSHQEDKRADAMKMGAVDFVNTGNDGWQEKYSMQLDYIISTIDVSKAIPIADLAGLLYVNGVLHLCAMPDDPIPNFKTQQLAANGCSISVNHIGSKAEAELMYKLAAEKGVRAWKEILPMKDVAKGVMGVKNNEVRYRYVLKQDINKQV